MRQAGGFDDLAPAHQFAVDKALQRFRRRAGLRRQTKRSRTSERDSTVRNASYNLATACVPAQPPFPSRMRRNRARRFLRAAGYRAPPAAARPRSRQAPALCRLDERQGRCGIGKQQGDMSADNVSKRRRTAFVRQSRGFALVSSKQIEFAESSIQSLFSLDDLCPSLR